MKGIRYYEPETVKEASTILVGEGPAAYVLAGGTDLIVRIQRGQWTVKSVVNIKKIHGLREIRVDGDSLMIGALGTLTDLENNAIVRARFPVLSQAAYLMSSWPVRNIATIAGNLCNASPGADLAPPFLCLEAEMLLDGLQGTRSIPARHWFVGPGKTSLSQGEVVTHIRIPLRTSEYKTVYKKLGVRQALDLAIASVCVSALRENSVLKDVRIALGSVAPVPMRAVQAEREAAGPALDSGHVAEIAAGECSPIDDVRASKWYRAEMIKVLTRRCLDEVAGS
jgi:carbon-monoxide dehydrogenase medium subunit